MPFRTRWLLVSGICLLTSRPTIAQQYSVTDLGAITPTAINGLGHIVGFSNANSQEVPHAVLWIDGTGQDLGTLPGATRCAATAINDSDQVVGACTVSSTNQAFLWTAETGMQALPIPMFAVAYGINAQGDIVGAYRCSDTGQCAFLFQNGGVEPLGDCTDCSADSINDQGQVAGMSSTRPMSWDANGQHDLGTLDPASVGAANAINAWGFVVGRSTTGASIHAVLWSPYGISDLGTLGGPVADARAINGNLIVGTSAATPSGDYRAFLYDNNGPGYPVDLNGMIPPDSGWVLERADGINAAGLIVGSGTLNQAEHGFLLTPVRSTATLAEEAASRELDPSSRKSGARPNHRANKAPIPK
jgi:probable HAF family extracellular repeat protein